MISPPLRSLQLNAGFSLFLSPDRTIFSNGCLKIRKRCKHSMTFRAKSLIGDGVLQINSKELLTGVPKNVLITPVTDGSMFLGAMSSESRSRHIFKIGVLEDYRFISLSRYKIWWMLPQMGNSGSDIPLDTQMLLLEAREDLTVDEGSLDVSKGGTFYVLFLPVLDGDFRSSLQGNPKNELEFCIESGDTSVETSQSVEAVFINYGNNPFDLVKNSMKILEKKKGTFSHRETKTVPGILDWFGWCTWDAFYTDVNPQGIEDGLKCFSNGGTPTRFLIIDDGWQDTANKFLQEGKPLVEGSQFASRLVSVKENKKFRKTANEETNDLKDFVTAIKKTYGLKYVYMWHALMGYWGGLDPDAPGTKKYNPKLLYPVQSPGNIAHTRCSNMAGMEKYGVGTIDPTKVFDFFDDQHSYLISQNIDGVKVDGQCVLETLGNGFGGRTSLTRQFQQALEKSISKNFQDNSIICCMAHNTDSVYHWKQCAIARASDDFFPEDPSSHSVHIAAVAFNSIFIGEVMVPDWDMFHSLHYAAEFHAVARAVGGCGVYVSDKPGQHDFTILKRLVLPDGSVLRAKYPGRPTRDCLFDDPVMGGKSLLKIWNLNTFSGVLGIFNCQGKGIWPCWNSDQKKTGPEISYLTGHVSPVDIEYLEEVAEDNWSGDCAVFSFKAGSLSRLPRNGSVNVTLEILKCDIFTISPIKVYNEKIQFAPIGLIEMYNSGGAIEAMDFVSDRSSSTLNMKGRGSGRFGAYSSIKPKFCTVNSKEEVFEFNIKDNFLTIIIPNATSFWEIAVHFEA